jgi:ethanolamine-phosphate cytidylyltransferase
MLQSRRFGDELLVGLHNDEDIAANKGPTVMNLAERVAAVNACRFSTKCIPHAPYVTSIPWISHYGCKYVTHGDDVTSDASGEDCYRFVKKAGRMKIVPRTPGISTTDLVGRMLSQTKDHFINNLVDCIEGREGKGSVAENHQQGKEMQKRILEYAAAPNGRDPFVVVYDYKPEHQTDDTVTSSSTAFPSMCAGIPPRPGQRLVYVDGGFDLFSSGHIAFLETVSKEEERLGYERGWYSEVAVQQRVELTGSDYAPSYVIAGVHNDQVINQHRGANYPIMNIFERGLCVIQCDYIHGVVFSAPYTPSRLFLESLPFGRRLDAVYHGPTAFMPPSLAEGDPYADAKSMGIFTETPTHEFQDVNAEHIVQRILSRREEYEERQRKKGAKNVGETAQQEREREELARRMSEEAAAQDAALEA